MIKRFFAATLCGMMLMAATAFAAVNINTANVQELSTLSGIGPSKAQAIIDYREKNGPFRSVNDLAKVKGIGAKTVQKLGAEISVGK
ncbi:MAG: ComEA family DNA-binding protein [Thermodesulfobacteriota bacterium]